MWRTPSTSGSVNVNVSMAAWKPEGSFTMPLSKSTARLASSTVNVRLHARGFDVPKPSGRSCGLEVINCRTVTGSGNVTSMKSPGAKPAYQLVLGLSSTRPSGTWTPDQLFAWTVTGSNCTRFGSTEDMRWISPLPITLNSAIDEKKADAGSGMKRARRTPCTSGTTNLPSRSGNGSSTLPLSNNVAPAADSSTTRPAAIFV